jgi:peptidyl-tRNA hydrolase, PTH1 family
VAEREIAVLLPQTFMNDSGRAVASALAALPGVAPASGLLVVYDELDLPFGRIRLRPRGSAGGQRGMASIIETLQSEDFARLRFGIGRPGDAVGAIDRVLAPFDAAEAPVLAERIARAVDAIEHVLAHGIASAMDRYNRAEAPTPAA